MLVIDKTGQERWKYSAGSWIEGVGVSSDGSIIAAGALDGTLYILDRNGNLLVKTTTGTLIRRNRFGSAGMANALSSLMKQPSMGLTSTDYLKLRQRELPLRKLLPPVQYVLPAPYL